MMAEWMRRDDADWSLRVFIVVLLGATLLVLFLALQQLQHYYFIIKQRERLKSPFEQRAQRLITLSNSVLDDEIAKSWVAMFPPYFCEFLARSVWFQFTTLKENDHTMSMQYASTSIYEVVLQDHRWRHTGLSKLLELVMCEIFTDDWCPILLICMEAISFLHLGEGVSKDIINTLFLHLLERHYSCDLQKATDSMSQSALSSASQRIQEHFVLLGIMLCDKKQYGYYILSSPIPHDAHHLTSAKWHTSFIQNLLASVLSGDAPLNQQKDSFQKCAVMYLPRLLTEQGRQYSKTADLLMNEGFIRLRIEMLGNLGGTRLHIADSIQLIDWCERGLATHTIPSEFPEQLCIKVAKYTTSGRAYFELGQFLLCVDEQSTNVVDLYLSAITQQHREYKACLGLVAKSFSNLATQYLCYEKQDLYQEYLRLSETLASELSLESLIQACRTHSKCEESCDEDTQTRGFMFRLDRIQKRLQEFVGEHLAPLSETYESICHLSVDDEMLQEAYLVLQTMSAIESIPQRQPRNTKKTFFFGSKSTSSNEKSPNQSEYRNTDLELGVFSVMVDNREREPLLDRNLKEL